MVMVHLQEQFNLFLKSKLESQTALGASKEDKMMTQLAFHFHCEFFSFMYCYK